MKKFIFTIIATIFFAVAADAQTKSDDALSLDNAIEVNFSKGTALTTKAANTYTLTLKANNDRSFNVASETVAMPYVTATTVAIDEIVNTIVKSSTPAYIGNCYSVSVF